MTNSLTPLGHEWATLQNNHEQYEKTAVLIKLTATLFCVLALGSDAPTPLTAAVVAVFWLIEGIFRTSQSRLGARLLHIETLVRQGEAPATAAYQLHSEWQAGRPGALGLIGEYLASAARPTVAFPYPILLIGGLLL